MDKKPLEDDAASENVNPSEDADAPSDDDHDPSMITSTDKQGECLGA